MLTLISPQMWKHNQSGDGFVYAVLLRPGTSQIVVSGRDCGEALSLLIRLVDGAERAVQLIAIGRELHGAANLSQRAGARLQIESSSPPARLAIWSHSRPHSADLWRRSLPKSLSGALTQEPRINQDRRASVAESLANGALSGPLDEIASGWLEGPVPADAIAAASALLQHLARHPLHRSNTLGALVAALCQKQGTI